MMKYQSYLAVRSIVSAVGMGLTAAILITSLGVMGSAIAGRAQWGKRFHHFHLVVLGLGFLLLCFYHIWIAINLPLLDPVSGQKVAAFFIPPWIENEKLLFWALCLAIFVTFEIRKKTLRTPLFLSGLLGLLSVSVMNPFLQPLSGFHAEITAYNQVFGSLSTNAKMIFEQMYGKLIYFYNSTYMWIHPPLLFLGYGALTLAFAGTLRQFRAVEAGDSLNFKWGRVGYLFLTAGIWLGYPWVLEAWQNEPWWWSPKINVTLLMWVLYTAYFHSRIYLEKRSMRILTISLSTASFVALVFTFITTYLIPGTHSYG